MQYNEVIEESLCYKTIRFLYRSFLESVFFRIFAGSVSTISGIFKEAVLGSESRRLFISSCSACRGKTRYFILASIMSILLLYISIDLLTSGRINYIPMSLFCAALFIVYLVKKGVIKYLASIYSYSFISRFMNRKI